MVINSSTYDCVNQVVRSEFQVRSLTIHKTCEGMVVLCYYEKRVCDYFVDDYYLAVMYSNNMIEMFLLYVYD